MTIEDGIDALLGHGSGHTPADGAFPVKEVAVDALVPGRYQPRRHFSDESLAELADSMREQGILQPLVARTVDGDERFEIVAGERRWQAAKIAGLATVPVIVRELDDQSALAVALIENLQREDLNAIDQAHSLKRLADEFSLTHEQVAKAVGRSRSSVSNLVRLLDLDGEVKRMLAERKIEMGHARALLALDSQRQVEIARKAERRGLSVRQVERAVRTALTAPLGLTDERIRLDLQTRWLQLQLEKEVGERIAIKRARNGAYTLSITFEDLGRLQRALQRILELIARIRETAGPRTRDTG